MDAVERPEGRKIADCLRCHAQAMVQDATSDLDVMFGPAFWVEEIEAERSFTLPDGRRIVMRMSIALKHGSTGHDG